MNNKTQARKHNSSLLQDLLDEVSPLEMEQTKVKMQLAARIEDFMLEKGWNKLQFAKEVKKNPSEITKWFSGTQNFTIEVLTEIAFALGVELSALFEKDNSPLIYRNEIIVKSSYTRPTKFQTISYRQKAGGLKSCLLFSSDMTTSRLQTFHA